MATYVALSTTNYQENGYTEYGRGSNKNEVEQAALKKIGEGQDIYTETLRTNLIIKSVTEAKRKGYLKKQE